jgi:hypothetical protein
MIRKLEIPCHLIYYMAGAAQPVPDEYTTGTTIVAYTPLFSTPDIYGKS